MITIPIRNIWLLQLFASDFQAQEKYVASLSETVPESIPRFVSIILADEVAARLSTGLTTGFDRIEQTGARVRGKIDVLTTARYNLMERGLIHCAFDQLSLDIPSNRLVLAALRRASRLPGTDPRCRRFAEELARGGISNKAPSRRERRGLRNQRMLYRDRTMMSAAELMLDLAIPQPGAGEHDVVAPEDGQVYMRGLFERAVGGFYRRVLSPQGWEVHTGKWLSWGETESTEGLSAILPRMQTDVIVRPPSAPPIIIDTKFTEITRANQYRQKKLKSEYLYQMYAYVRTQEENPKLGPDASGLLLHPVVEGSVREETRIGAHSLGVATVDLSASYPQIYRELMQVVSATQE